MNIIKKVNPTNIRFIKHLYGLVKSLNNKEYEKLF